MNISLPLNLTIFERPVVSSPMCLAGRLQLKSVAATLVLDGASAILRPEPQTGRLKLSTFGRPSTSTFHNHDLPDHLERIDSNRIYVLDFEHTESDPGDLHKAAALPHNQESRGRMRGTSNRHLFERWR